VIVMIVAGVLAILRADPCLAENWPRFRGPTGQGVSREKNLPVTWSVSENLAWRVHVPGIGWSSPIVWDDRVFVTSAAPDGTSCHVLSIDAAEGKLVWDKEVFRQAAPREFAENSHATPTPVADGKLVYTAFNGGQPKPVADSPFGVVCPWPGVEAAGVKWCRVGAGATAFVNWPDIEKTPGNCDWTAADNEIRQLADPLGLSLLPIFGYTPKWASRAPDDAEFQFYPPRDVAQFGRFVRQCVRRYKHRVKVWEVWNEPNIGFFRGSAAEYAEMVKAAAAAAKQEDPDCRIAMGCAGVDLDFLERLYEFGCGPFIDLISVHPYQWGRQLNDGWMLDKLQACRRLLDRHGDKHKGIWITEIGWSLSEGVTAQEQADLLVQAVVTGLSVRERLKVEKVFWFCVKDWGGPGHGLFDVAGKPKPALFAYQAVTAELDHAHYRGPWTAPAGMRGHVFDRAGEPVLVLWTPSPEGKARLELNASAPGLSLRTVTNENIHVPAIGARAAVDVTHPPVFVTGMKWSDLDVVPASRATAPPPTPKTRLSSVPRTPVVPQDTGKETR
jgi:hypothetical protein